MTSRSAAIRISKPLLGAVVTGTTIYTLYYRPFGFGLPQAAAEAPVEPKKFFNGFPLQFVDLRLEEAWQVNHDTKKLRFSLPDERDVSGISVISAILTKATVEGAWLPTLRPYSPISDPDTPGHFDLLVKKYPKGSMSTHLHDLEIGQTHSFMRKPLSEYAYTPNKHSHIVLIAGGAGITPLYQLTRMIFRNPTDMTKVSLIFGVNTSSDLLFREEFQDLRREFPDRFDVVYTVTNPGDDVAITTTERKGRVTAELLRETVPSPDTEGLKIFFCGPLAMEEAIVGAKRKFNGVLQGLGYKQEQVHKL